MIVIVFMIWQKRTMLDRTLGYKSKYPFADADG